MVLVDEKLKQLSSYAMLSPLYLSSDQSNSLSFVNNAKILATHLIQIDADTFQVLHLIDQPLEFAYVNKRTQLRSPSGTSSTTSRSTNLKRSISLDDLWQPTEQQALIEFQERFADIQTQQPLADLYRARALKGGQRVESLTKRELNLERLMTMAKSQPKLRGKLHQLNESQSLNTYFLPVNSDQLQSLLDNHQLDAEELLEAHIIPGRVLFTRQMSLGEQHSTMLSRSTLSLAKSIPASNNHELLANSPELYLSSPLLVQSTFRPAAQSAASAASVWPAGVTSAEIVLANVPISSGVLHLIKRPLLSTELKLLDYLNDNNNELTNAVCAIGTQTSAKTASTTTGRSRRQVKVNRFRELLAREQQMLASMGQSSLNMTVLAPSDEAFAKLRYDLRALVTGDESLIPKHWASAHRHDLLERMVKRHVIVNQIVTSDQFDSTQSNSFVQASTENGKLAIFSSASSSKSCQFQLEADSTQTCLIHHDLIGTNGVMHIIDKVLGEEQETLDSLLKSMVLKFDEEQHQSTSNNLDQLQQLIQSNIRSAQDSASISSSADLQQVSVDPASARRTSPELDAISSSISQYLNELANSNTRQLQLLGASVNISYQLARLTSLAEGLDDWNDKFQQPDRLFTYFVPSDLAWLRLQQARPELHKPLMHFLEQQFESSSQQSSSATQDDNSLASANKLPHSSESSHRLRQVSTILVRQVSNAAFSKRSTRLVVFEHSQLFKDTQKSDIFILAEVGVASSAG